MFSSGIMKSTLVCSVRWFGLIHLWAILNNYGKCKTIIIVLNLYGLFGSRPYIKICTHIKYNKKTQKGDQVGMSKYVQKGMKGQLADLN